MNTIKQLIAICDERLKIMGISRTELLKRAGLSETVFTMALARNSYLKVESLVAISEILGIPLMDLLGLKEEELPHDIKVMEDMLLKIPEKDRKMIFLNIKNYYEISFTEKKKK
jgi:lambda repressor-like predicted transcriptional regulator